MGEVAGSDFQTTGSSAGRSVGEDVFSGLVICDAGKSKDDLHHAEEVPSLMTPDEVAGGRDAVIWWVVAALLVILYLVQVAIYGRLRARHENLWEQLGRPTMVSHFQMGVQKSMARFFRQRQHKDLDDPTLTALVRVYKWMLNGMLLLLAVGILLVLLG